jgi:hypothetical protein
MFSEAVIGTDRFLDMSTKAQVLYLHLNMDGDDDGFVASPKKICRAVGCSEKELRTLEEAGFILRFPSGVVCIVDWHRMNTLKNDRYTPTVYQEELHMLDKDSSRRYYLREVQETEETTYSESERTGDADCHTSDIGHWFAMTCNEETATAETDMEQTRNQSGTTLEPTWNQAGTKVEPQHNITKHNLIYESITERSEASMGRASPSPTHTFFSYAETGERAI